MVRPDLQHQAPGVVQAVPCILFWESGQKTASLRFIFSWLWEEPKRAESNYRNTFHVSAHILPASLLLAQAGHMDKSNIRRARKYTLCPVERQQRIKGNRTIYQLERTFRKMPTSVISAMNLYKVTHACNHHPCEDIEHFPYPEISLAPLIVVTGMCQSLSTSATQPPF